MNKKILFIYSSSVLLALPTIIFALTAPVANPLAIENFLFAILNLLWLVFATLAIIAFIIAGITFLSANGDPGKVRQGRDAVIWGVVGVGVALLSVSIPEIMKVYLGV